ncbi:MAG: 3-hydroxyacyl-ACP dehydratase FabZ [Burkholderiales bacterium]|nr:3-hydroxyacyl-ACP dehydratase FabZ [Burkholderiales bacterium]
MTLNEFDLLLHELPRRYPALLIDRLDECVIGERATGRKYVTTNEPFFQGHFPAYPVMPGVLVLEALIQLSTLLAASSGQRAPGTVVTVDAMRFKRQVIPGDILLLKTWMADGGRFRVRASVGDEIAAEADILLTTDAPVSGPGG